jgi:gamma-glutamyl-gamma-aminobutyrate hydrolase PuuD
LLLTGGGDLDPVLYAAQPHPRTVRVQPGRDTAELALLRAAFDAGLPILGICRGLQLLNVFRRGTLVQHLPDTAGHDGHAPGPAQYGERAVQVAAGSRAAEIIGRDTLSVPCHHHQAIERLGVGLTATAWSDDGVIEAVELAGHPFVIAVQWHPEVTEDDSLFIALAAAAGARRAVPMGGSERRRRPRRQEPRVRGRPNRPRPASGAGRPQLTEPADRASQQNRLTEPAPAAPARAAAQDEEDGHHKQPDRHE